MTIKSESKGQIEGRYRSFTASTLSKVPSRPSLSTKCLVSVVFFANMFVGFCCFSLGTPPQKTHQWEPTRVGRETLPVAALASAPKATIVFIAGSQTQRVWHLSR